MKCCICGKEIVGFGNNPDPVIDDEEARCCDECDMNVVIPIRIIQMRYYSNKTIDKEKEAEAQETNFKEV